MGIVVLNSTGNLFNFIKIFGQNFPVKNVLLILKGIFFERQCVQTPDTSLPNDNFLLINCIKKQIETMGGKDLFASYHPSHQLNNWVDLCQDWVRRAFLIF